MSQSEPAAAGQGEQPVAGRDLAPKIILMVVAGVVVVASALILVALLLPFLLINQDSHRRAQCINNQHQFTLAHLQFEASRQKFCGYKNNFATTSGYVTTSWVPMLFPYIEHQDWADYWRKGRAQPCFLKLAFCPSNPPEQANQTDTPLSYVVNCGRQGSAREYEGIFFDQTDPDQPTVSLSYISQHDGSTNTLLLAECLHAGPWHTGTSNFNPNPSCPTSGTDNGVGFQWVVGPTAKITNHISSRHGGGMVVSFCDGRQYFLRDDIYYGVYQHLMAPSGAEAGLSCDINEDSY